MTEHVQVITEASLEATIISAKKGSISNLGRLKGLVVDCPQDRLLRILPALYHHLNPKRVPLPGTIPFPNTTVDLALRALDILAATRPILSADKPQTLTVRSLAQFWPSIWSWLLFFMTQYTLKNPEIPPDARTATIAISLDAIFAFSSSDVLRTTIYSTPGVMQNLCKIWRLEAKDPNYYPRTLSDKMDDRLWVGKPLCVYMMVLAIDNHADWERRVIEPMGGDLDEIAIVALRHLRDDFSRWTEWDHTWVLTHVRLLSNVSFCKPICVATLSRKSIRLVTEIIVSLVNKSDTSIVHTTYPRSSCLPYCCLYLGRFLDEYGANTVIQAIQAGIIPALLRTGPWMSQRLEDKTLAGYTLGLISDVIPRYMLYRSVLRALAKSFEDIRALGLEAKMAKTGRLWETWSRFKALFEERWEIQLGLEEFFLKSHKSCHNKEKIDIQDEYKACSGCLETYYCSLDCQKHDWKRYNHKAYCKAMQKLRGEGRSAPLSRRDFNFIQAVAEHDCRKKRDEILAIRARDNIKTLVVEHDYSVYPFTMRVGSPETCYPAHGGLDAQELGDWEGCLQKAKANPEGVAILMVLTAEGICSKLWITTRSPEYLTEAFLSEDELNEDSKELVKVKQS